MPLLVTYRGRPVKRRRRVGEHLKLIFFAPLPGQSGDQHLVTQFEWQQFGRIQFVTPSEKPNVRRMSAS